MDAGAAVPERLIVDALTAVGGKRRVQRMSKMMMGKTCRRL
jgi:hypothetical protein